MFIKKVLVMNSDILALVIVIFLKKIIYHTCSKWYILSNIERLVYLLTVCKQL